MAALSRVNLMAIHTVDLCPVRVAAIFREESPASGGIDYIDAEKRMHEALRQRERRLAAQKHALQLAVSGIR
jgi:hypothetical protein